MRRRPRFDGVEANIIPWQEPFSRQVDRTNLIAEDKYDWRDTDIENLDGLTILDQAFGSLDLIEELWSQTSR